MKPSDYLDLAQKKVGVRSDNALGVKLKWGRSKINNYRHNRQMMDNEAARQIAEVLDIPGPEKPSNVIPFPTVNRIALRTIEKRDFE